MAMPSHPPAFIVFEGPEGIGKSTQVGLLADALRRDGRDVVAVREPGGTPTGDAIRALLLDPASDLAARTEALLFMASRAELVDRVIAPALARNATVIADRFFLSTFAYQCGGRGLDTAELEAANRLATGGVIPGLTILLRLPTDEGLARAERRGARDRIERADREFHDRVAAAFDHFARPDWQARHPECGPVVVVDATGTQSDVFARVQRAVTDRWP
jgi:dTMP kinase